MHLFRGAFFAKMRTQFQNKVYELLNIIPKGRVITYKILAERLGISAYKVVDL